MHKLLLSYAGTTDPFRSLREGPLLHIVHHYQPQDCIIIFSAEIQEKEIEDSAIQASLDFYLRQLHPGKTVSVSTIHSVSDLKRNDQSDHCSVQMLFTGIKNPHLFDEVNRLNENIITKLVDMKMSTELIFNVSSGTPQMIQSLVILGVYYKSSPNVDIKIVQVDSPNKESGKNHAHENSITDGDIEAYFYNEFDKDNRCREPDFFYVQRIQAKKKLLGLLEHYNYVGAEQLLNNYKNLPNLVSENTRSLIKHWSLRSQYRFEEADNCIKDRSINKRLTPLNNNYEARRLFEYFLTMQINFRKQSRSIYILQLSPYITNILAYYLNDVYREAYQVITKKSGRIDKPIDIQKVKRFDQSLFSQLNRPSLDGNQFINISLSVLLRVFDCFRKKDDSKPQAAVIYPKMEALREVERKLRNKVAHEMCIVDDESIIDRVGQNFASINRDIIGISKIIFPDVNESVWDSFLSEENKYLCDLIYELEN